MAKLCAAGIQLREQIDDDYPDRDRKSDGWIADSRHIAKGTSDHIPDSKSGIVRAIDIDADLSAHKEEAYALVEKIRKLGKNGDKRIAYIIFDGKIMSPILGWKRRKATDLAKFDLDFDNSMQLLEAAVSRGYWFDENNQQRSVDDLAGMIQTAIVNQSILIGDAGIQKEYSEKFRVALRTAKTNAVIKHLQSDEYIGDTTATLEKLRLRQVGKMSGILNDLFNNDMDSYAKVVSGYMLAANQREEAARRKREDEKRTAEATAINLLEQIYPIKDKNNPKRQALIKQVMDLPPGSLPIGTIKDLLEPEKEEQDTPMLPL